MTEEVACCGQLCCPACVCAQGGPCDCAECPCCGSAGVTAELTTITLLDQSATPMRTGELIAAGGLHSIRVLP